LVPYNNNGGGGHGGEDLESLLRAKVRADDANPTLPTRRVLSFQRPSRSRYFVPFFFFNKTILQVRSRRSLSTPHPLPHYTTHACVCVCVSA
jgi:hypothetical protein